MQQILDSIGAFIQSVDFSTPTWDLFIALMFIVGAFIYGFSLGRDRIIGFLVSIYMSFAIATNVPFLERGAEATVGNLEIFRVIVFFAAFVVLFLIFERNGIFHNPSVATVKNILFTIILSILHVGLMISIALALLPNEISQQLSETTRYIFLSDEWRFIWIVAPIVALGLIRKKDE